jgi:hypothetical protein
MKWTWLQQPGDVSNVSKSGGNRDESFIMSIRRIGGSRVQATLFTRASRVVSVCAAGVEGTTTARTTTEPKTGYFE